MTVEQARQLATTARGELVHARRSGLPDPLETRRQKRQAASDRRGAPTVAEVADAYLAECAAKLKRSTVAEYRRLLGTTVAKQGRQKGTERVGELRTALGHRKVHDVTRAMVAKLHLSMADTPYKANRCLAVLSGLFTYAEQHGHRPIGSNPCRSITPFRESARERYLTAEEFARLGAVLSQAEREGLPIPENRVQRRATDATRKHRTKDTDDNGVKPLQPFSPEAVGVLRFLLLTGWRKGEAESLRWDAIDTERGIATLEDSKSGRSIRELGAPALELVEQMRAYRQLGNPHVFPGRKAGEHFKGTSRVWDVVRQAAGLPDVRLHDLRHAFASVAASGGLTLHIIGKLLGHTDQATTQRYAHLADSTRRSAADAVALAVQAALSGPAAEKASEAAVLPFKERGA